MIHFFHPQDLPNAYRKILQNINLKAAIYEEIYVITTASEPKVQQQKIHEWLLERHPAHQSYQGTFITIAIIPDSTAAELKLKIPL